MYMRGHAGDDAAGGGLPHPGVQENADASAGRGRAVFGLVLALALSATLAWCVGRGGDRTLDAQTLQKAPPIPTVQTRPSAHAEPSGAQVTKAYEDAREVYAQGGADALMRFSRGCLESLHDDARVLDYCLAFGVFADAIRARAPDEPDQAQRLAAARAALPAGADAPARLAAVLQLTRAVAAPTPAPSSPPATRALSAAGPAAARRTKGSETRKASSRAAAATANAKASATRCRLMSTPAERVLCADASLRAADRRMRAAYNRAIASGESAERRHLVREQASWRVELHAAAPNRRKVAALYERRIRELRAAAR